MANAKRTLSAKQKAALAKGRKKAAAKRRKPATRRSKPKRATRRRASVGMSNADQQVVLDQALREARR